MEFLNLSLEFMPASGLASLILVRFIYHSRYKSIHVKQMGDRGSGVRDNVDRIMCLL